MTYRAVDLMLNQQWTLESERRRVAGLTREKWLRLARFTVALGLALIACILWNRPDWVGAVIAVLCMPPVLGGSLFMAWWRWKMRDQKKGG